MIDLAKILEARGMLMDAAGDCSPTITLHVSQSDIDMLENDDRATMCGIEDIADNHVVDMVIMGGVTFIGPCRVPPCSTCDGTGTVEELARGSNDPQTAHDVGCPDCNPEPERDYDE